MESSSNVIPLIEEALSKIIFLLTKYDEKNWASYLTQVLQELKKNNDPDKQIITIRNLFKGGMGSFNDIALASNGKILIKETDYFLKLQDELFELVTHKYKLNTINENVVDFNSKKTKDDAV